MKQVNILLAVIFLGGILFGVYYSGRWMPRIRAGMAFQRAEKLEIRGRYRESVRAYENVVRSYPASPEAADWYREYINLPEKKTGWIALGARITLKGQIILSLAGIELAKLNDPRGAIKYLDEYVTLYPESMYARGCQYLIGEIHERYLQDREAALAAYWKVLVLPDDTGAFNDGIKDDLRLRKTMLDDLGMAADPASEALERITVLKQEGVGE